MQTALQAGWWDAGVAAGDPRSAAAGPAAEARTCPHCGSPCGGLAVEADGEVFCCSGCQTVHALLLEHGLGQFYRLQDRPGAPVRLPGRPDRFAYLDEAGVRDRLLEFSDGTVSRVRFRIPAIHCIACVWLLEHLFRLHPGIGRSTVDFPRKEVVVTFQHGQLTLGALAALLASLGYEPELRLEDAAGRPGQAPGSRRLHLQVGIAGFAFGNIMLFSVPGYFGFDPLSGPGFQRFFGGLSLLLALPVLVYSAGDYWRSAWMSLRQRVLTIDLPIAVGLVALFGQSAFEILSGGGPGYLDSLSGLVFFLLVGRTFQQTAYQRLSFDRDYRSFFPLAVVRRSGTGEETVPVSSIAVGDRLVLRHGELLPADARLAAGSALMDYSFVTGEAEPVERQAGDLLMAGGRQVGGLIEVETVRPVSQSHLTSLWREAAFSKARDHTLDSTLNRFSRRFVGVVTLVAVGAAGWWWWHDQAAVAIKAFVSVLIVACPCALALSAPFALGTAQRFLARRGMFLRGPAVIEAIARIRTVVLDKTGTLTSTGPGGVIFEGPPLTPAARSAIRSLARQSTHPHAVRLTAALRDADECLPVDSFQEVTGAGLRGRVGAEEVQLGSARWLAGAGVTVPTGTTGTGGEVHVAIGGRHLGRFRLEQALRPRVRELIQALARRYEVVLLSGDTERERERFRSLLGPAVPLRFNQGPRDKLRFVEATQESGRRVMMVGDGLNDAGALRQSEVGVAVVEHLGAFTPASDVIVEARAVPALSALIEFSQGTVRVVWLSILLSSLYNVVGLGIAASGQLAPMICAILMPLSSISVVAFACGATAWVARRCDWGGRRREDAESLAQGDDHS